MSESKSWLQVRAAGRDFLLSTLDLREVVAPIPVSPLPGGSRGIAGVVIHQGEFLPVLAWRDLQGCKVGSESPMALAILRFRLAMPLDRLGVTLDLGPDIWRKPAKMDPWHSWINAVGRIGGRDLPRMDVDRLLALLRGFRDGR